MAHPQNTIQNSKFKHLSAFEREQVAALHKDGHSNREITQQPSKKDFEPSTASSSF